MPYNPKQYGTSGFGDAASIVSQGADRRANILGTTQGLGQDLLGSLIQGYSQFGGLAAQEKASRRNAALTREGYDLEREKAQIASRNNLISELLGMRANEANLQLGRDQLGFQKEQAFNEQRRQFDLGREDENSRFALAQKFNETKLMSEEDRFAKELENRQREQMIDKFYKDKGISLSEDQLRIERERLDAQSTQFAQQLGLSREQLEEQIRGNRFQEGLSREQFEEQIRGNRFQEGMSEKDFGLRRNDSYFNRLFNFMNYGLSREGFEEQKRSASVAEALAKQQFEEQKRSNLANEDITRDTNENRLLKQYEEDAVQSATNLYSSPENAVQIAALNNAQRGMTQDKIFQQLLMEASNTAQEAYDSNIGFNKGISRNELADISDLFAKQESSLLGYSNPKYEAIKAFLKENPRIVRPDSMISGFIFNKLQMDAEKEKYIKELLGVR